MADNNLESTKEDKLDLLDATLCFVAMYGIPVPDKEYEVFCKGFMHTKGYQEAKASINKLFKERFLELVQNVCEDSTDPDVVELKTELIKAIEDRYSDGN